MKKYSLLGLSLLAASPALTASASNSPKFSPTDSSIEEIVVTARKRNESIQDIPVSVTPFTAEEMNQRGYSNMEDIAAATAGFTFESGISGGHHSNATIRGLSPQFTIARVQNVSFFMDGVYMPRQSMLNVGLIDMERVEVVKGPQNALYGRNAFAGAVNYIPARPGTERHGYASTTLGLHDRADARFMLTGPLTDSGSLLGRIAYGYTSFDGHTENQHPVKNADPTGPNTKGRLGGWEDEALNIALQWYPTEDIAVNFGYYTLDIERETNPGYMISGLGAQRFGLRTAAENDLNCNSSTQNDISGQRPVTGNTLYCGELPKAASDIAYRRVNGIVIDPRGYGAIGYSDFYTLNASWAYNENLSFYYVGGMASHDSNTTGGPGGEDPILGQSIATNIPLSITGGERGITRINSFASRPHITADTYSHELRFDWVPDARLQLTGGLYYSVVEDTEWTELYLNSHCNADSPQQIANCWTPTTAPSPIPEASELTSPIVYDQGLRQHANAKAELTDFVDKIYAAFLSISYDIDDRWNLTFEARHTIEDKSVHRKTDSFAIADGDSYTYTAGIDPILPLPPDSANGRGNSLPNQTTLVDSIILPKDDEVFRYFTPRAILSFDYSEEHMMYLSAAKGLKTGGFNNAEDESQAVYDVSENITVELGSKNQFLNHRFIVNGSAFYIAWDNLQGSEPPVVATLTSSDLISNLGNATSYGIEVESQFRFNRWWSLDGSYTYNNATYDDGVIFFPARDRIDCDGSVCREDGDVGGKQMPRSSKHQASLGLNYSTDLFNTWSMHARLDANYQSRQYITALNLAYVPDRLISNASLSFQSHDGKWDIGLWGKNILDVDTPAQAFYLTIFNQYIVSKVPGRQAGLNIKFNF